MATISEIREQIEKIIHVYKGIDSPSMFIWGAPGLGKSTMVRQLAEENNLEFVDVRLSQLAPTDIRGLPIVDREKSSMSWAPPNFLPRQGAAPGILFLDEFNMANGAMMSLSQQLILDRRVGDYILPDNWTIIAAGNRASDRAAVNEMPSPVANRFIHFHADHNLGEFKSWALNNLSVSNKTLGVLLGFLNFRPELLHKPSKVEPAWPSPRTWEWGAKLIDHGLDLASVVGEAAAIQFRAFQKTAAKLQFVDSVLEGDLSVALPDKDPSLVYATISTLAARSETSTQYLNSLKWILKKDITEDYAGVYVSEVVSKLEKSPKIKSQFIKSVFSDTEASEFIKRYDQLTSGFKL